MFLNDLYLVQIDSEFKLFGFARKRTIHHGGARDVRNQFTAWRYYVSAVSVRVLKCFWCFPVKFVPVNQFNLLKTKCQRFIIGVLYQIVPILVQKRQKKPLFKCQKIQRKEENGSLQLGAIPKIVFRHHQLLLYARIILMYVFINKLSLFSVIYVF